MVNSFINNYFGFNRQQRNGLFVLLVISVLLLLVRLVYPAFITPDAIVVQNLPLIEQKVEHGYNTANSSRKNYAREHENTKLFVFNPNTVSFEQLIQLGFREKTAKTFLKFRSKGFVFKEKKDLQKIYGISDRFYEKLEPYILVDSRQLISGQSAAAVEQSGSKQLAVTQVARPQQKVELNSCDSLALVALNGIGPSYAKRILKYRGILGGYVSVEQLKEVYGFPEELFEKVKPLVTVNPTLVKKIDLNKDDFKTVNKHPYLSYELTKTIFNWRRKTVITPANLKEIVKDDALCAKLMPYLIFES